MWRNETGAAVILKEQSGVFSSGVLWPGDVYRLEGVAPGAYRVRATTPDGRLMWEGEVHVGNGMEDQAE